MPPPNKAKRSEFRSLSIYAVKYLPKEDCVMAAFRDKDTRECIDEHFSWEKADYLVSQLEEGLRRMEEENNKTRNPGEKKPRLFVKYIYNTNRENDEDQVFWLDKNTVTALLNGLKAAKDEHDRKTVSCVN